MSSEPFRSNPAAPCRRSPILGRARPSSRDRPRSWARPSRCCRGRAEQCRRSTRCMARCGWTILRLRNREDPEVIAPLEAENQYTEAVMRHTERCRSALPWRCAGGSGDRPLGSGAAGWLALLLAHRWRERSIRSSAAVPVGEDAQKRSCWTQNRWLRGTPTSGWASGGESGPPAPRLRGGHQPGLSRSPCI